MCGSHGLPSSSTTKKSSAKNNLKINPETGEWEPPELFLIYETI